MEGMGRAWREARVLIDLLLADEEALVVGGGVESEIKTIRLLDARARVTVLGEAFTERLAGLASRNPRRVRLVPGKLRVGTLEKAIARTAPVVVFISTGEQALDERLARAARGRASSRPPLVCVVDEPALNDFNMPAIARLGDIRVGVSTGGRSPAMAGILRRRIEKVITPEDVLQVRLQGSIRKASRKRLHDAGSRRGFAYRVIQDSRIGALLRERDYQGARRLAERMLAEESNGNR